MPVQVQPQHRAPFHRSATHLPCHLEVRVVGGCWQPSGKLPFDNVGEYSFQMVHETPELTFENLRYEVRCVKATTFVIFRNEVSRRAAFRVINQTDEDLSLRQKG